MTFHLLYSEQLGTGITRFEPVKLAGTKSVRKAPRALSGYKQLTFAEILELVLESTVPFNYRKWCGNKISMSLCPEFIGFCHKRLTTGSQMGEARRWVAFQERKERCRHVSHTYFMPVTTIGSPHTSSYLMLQELFVVDTIISVLQPKPWNGKQTSQCVTVGKRQSLTSA